MLWLCIRSPGYCSQVVPYAYLGILRSRLPIHKICTSVKLHAELSWLEIANASSINTKCSLKVLFNVVSSINTKCSLKVLFNAGVCYRQLVARSLTYCINVEQNVQKGHYELFLFKSL